jgi:virginiamycin B lyase
MRPLSFLLILVVAVTATMFPPASGRTDVTKNDASVSLTGQVTSAEEGAMEGVLVSAKKSGSTMTLTVVSDERGSYRFPAARLGAGHYSLRVRAGGYDLEGPSDVNIAAGKSTTVDLKLRKTTNLGSQLTNADWLVSFPGTSAQKASIEGCTHCHTLERIARSHYDADEFLQIIDRMSRHTPESFPLLVQPDGPGRIGGGELSTGQLTDQEGSRRKEAQYLSTLNLSAVEEWSYPLQVAPRPRGKDTQVMITEYDLPKRTRQPHDVIVDSDGTVWYASFGEEVLGRLDPRTGKTTEFPIPMLKPGHIMGTLDLEFDEDQNVWLAMTFQGGVAKFDRKTQQFTTYKLPPDLDADYRELLFLSPNHSHVDGKVWIADSGSYTILRLDIVSGKFEVFEPFPVPRPNVYQITSDAQNNGYFAVFGREDVGRIDAKTKEIIIYPTPTHRSGPRRGMIDAQGRFWFAENRANKIGVFDTRTTEMREWALPNPLYFPYSVTSDKNGEVWAVSEFTDSILRLDPTSGQTVSYLMPRETNMRRAFVDNTTNPVTFWVGNTHGASILRVEPQEGVSVAKSKE